MDLIDSRLGFKRLALGLVQEWKRVHSGLWTHQEIQGDGAGSVNDVVNMMMMLQPAAVTH